MGHDALTKFKASGGKSFKKGGSPQIFFVFHFLPFYDHRGDQPSRNPRGLARRLEMGRTRRPEATLEDLLQLGSPLGRAGRDRGLEMSSL